MKKVYRTSKYIRYSKRKAEKEFRKRQKNSNKKQKTLIEGHNNSKKLTAVRGKNKNRRRELRHNIKKDIKESLAAPRHFSLVEDNDLETANFFKDLLHKLDCGIPVTLDLSFVERITPDSILYLLSLMDIFKQRRALQVEGNAPHMPRCKALFLQSGFYNYVNSKYKNLFRNPDILTIKTGRKVDGRILSETIEFASKRLAEIKTMSLKDTYRVLSEGTANTLHHAYDENTDYRPDWWLMALIESNVIQYCILDNGKGIPNTILRSYGEKIRAVFKMSPKQNDLIHSAMLGKFRSSSGEKTRGKGLQSMYKAFQRGTIQDLTIISDKAFLKYGLDAKGKRTVVTKEDREMQFAGTLISWKVF